MKDTTRKRFGLQIELTSPPQESLAFNRNHSFEAAKKEVSFIFVVLSTTSVISVAGKNTKMSRKINYASRACTPMK